MNSRIKNNVYNKVNALLISKVKINSFEKKPINGGTPAIENIINVNVVK